MSAYLFDTETTDRTEGEIIEAGWIKIAAAADLFAALGDPGDAIPRPLRAEGTHYARYKPMKRITFGAMAVHHILPHELVDCPPSSEFKLPGDCKYIVGHSIDFDWEAAGRPDVKRIDTHAIAQWLWPEASGYSLVALIYMHEGANERTRNFVRGAHCAIDDCQLALILLGHILAAKPDIRTWAQLWEYSEECRIPRTCPMKRWDGVLLEDMDDGAIRWCLNQDWLDPYLRKGLVRVVEKREAEWRARWAAVRQAADAAAPIACDDDCPI